MYEIKESPYKSSFDHVSLIKREGGNETTLFRIIFPNNSIKMRQRAVQFVSLFCTFFNIIPDLNNKDGRVTLVKAFQEESKVKNAPKLPEFLNSEYDPNEQPTHIKLFTISENDEIQIPLDFFTELMAMTEAAIFSGSKINPKHKQTYESYNSFLLYKLNP